MQNSCLKIKRVWSDVHSIELQMTIESIYASSKQLSLYVSEEDILDWKQAFTEFPKSPTDVFEWSVGNKKDNTAYFFRIRLFLYDKLGHAAIEIETDNKLSIPHRASTHFYLPTEVSSINRLGKSLDTLLQDDYVEVEGITLYIT